MYRLKMAAKYCDVFPVFIRGWIENYLMMTTEKALEI